MFQPLYNRAPRPNANERLVRSIYFSHRTLRVQFANIYRENGLLPKNLVLPGAPAIGIEKSSSRAPPSERARLEST